MKYLKTYENYNLKFTFDVAEYHIKSFLSKLLVYYSDYFDEISIYDLFSKSKELRSELSQQIETYMNEYQYDFSNFHDWITNGSSYSGEQDVFYHPFEDMVYLDMFLEKYPDELSDVISYYKKFNSEQGRKCYSIEISDDIKKKYSHLFDSEEIGLIWNI